MRSAVRSLQRPSPPPTPSPLRTTLCRPGLRGVQRSGPPDLGPWFVSGGAEGGVRRGPGRGVEWWRERRDPRGEREGRAADELRAANGGDRGRGVAKAAEEACKGTGERLVFFPPPPFTLSLNPLACLCSRYLTGFPWSLSSPFLSGSASLLSHGQRRCPSPGLMIAYMEMKINTRVYMPNELCQFSTFDAPGPLYLVEAPKAVDPRPSRGAPRVLLGNAAWAALV